jgi:muconolactone delta-isomerase
MAFAVALASDRLWVRERRVVKLKERVGFWPEFGILPKDLLAPLDAPLPRRPRFRWVVDATGALCPRPNRTTRAPA